MSRRFRDIARLRPFVSATEEQHERVTHQAVIDAVPRAKIQTPPDLVVKSQPVDITDAILWLVLRTHVVYQREIKG